MNADEGYKWVLKLDNAGCDEQATMVVNYDLKVTRIGFNQSTNSQIVHIEYVVKLAANNINYTALNATQDPSAWLEFYDKDKGYVESLHTFAPREDCTTTSNSISGEIDVAVFNWDKSIVLNARVSYPTTVGEWGSSDSMEYAIPEEFVATPPQNLQVTFTKPSGTLDSNAAGYYLGGVRFTPVLEKWSDAEWAAVEPEYGNFCPFRVEILSEDRKSQYGLWRCHYASINRQETPITWDMHSLWNPWRNAYEERLFYSRYANRNYCVKVSAENIAGLSTSVYSPVFTTPPPAMAFSQPEKYHTEDGKSSVVFRYGIAPNAGAKPIHYSIEFTADGVALPDLTVNGVVPAGQTDGLPISEDTKVSVAVPAGAMVVVRGYTWAEGEDIKVSYGFTTNTSLYAPELDFKFSPINLNDDVTISATLNGVAQKCVWQVGYTEDGEDVVSPEDYAEWAEEHREPSDKLTITDLPHGQNKTLYAKAWPAGNGGMLDMVRWNNNYGQITIPIPDAVHGIIKTCDETKNIVDVVESKGGILTPQWANGQKVKVVDRCKGYQMLYGVNYTPSESSIWQASPNNSNHLPLDSFYVKDGWLVLKAGIQLFPKQTGSLSSNTCILPLSWEVPQTGKYTKWLGYTFGSPEEVEALKTVCGYFDILGYVENRSGYYGYMQISSGNWTEGRCDRYDNQHIYKECTGLSFSLYGGHSYSSTGILPIDVHIRPRYDNVC